jgi:membrane fusion protein, multidrug efflux system
VPHLSIRPGAARGQLGLAALGLSAVLGLCGCHGKGTVAPTATPVVAAAVHPLPAGSAGSTLEFPVEVAPRYSNALSFRVSGKLIERSVRLGDSVRRGQIIARLDASDAEHQAAAALAVAEAAEHRLKYAKQQLDRDRAQSAANLIATNELEQTEDAYSAALASRDQAAAQLVVARNALAYQTLLADHDGLITSEDADTGQVIAAGQAIFGLAWSGDVDVVLDASASEVGSVVVGGAAAVTFPALPGKRFEAKVRERSPFADRQSRTYKIKLTLQAPGSDVRLGMTGEARLVPNGPTAPARPLFRVPATALFHRGQQPALWVVSARDSILELRPVTVGRYGDRWVEVAQGLSDGERVVFAGVHTVYEGERVKPVPPLFVDEGAADPTVAIAQEAGRVQ